MMPEEDRTLLGRLAQAYGLAADYFDIWGTRHEVSPETQAAVLRAMGVPVASHGDRVASLAALHARYWCRLCDPVLVLRDATAARADWRLRVRSHEGEDAAWRASWSVSDEKGTVVLRDEMGPGCPVVEVSAVDGERHVALRAPVPSGLAHGYYAWQVRVTNGEREYEGRSRLIVAPDSCYVPSDVAAGRRIWGLWVQLYSLRSQRNWGIGDLSDLAELTRWVGRDLGGAVVGVNPLHALKNRRPHHVSPYSPDSRSALNEVYLDPLRVPEYDRCAAAQHLVTSEAFQSRLDELRRSDLVDYEGVAGAKLEVLELLYRQFVADHCGEHAGLSADIRRTERGRAFARFCAERGAAFEEFAVYRVLSEQLGGDPRAPRLWREWPVEFRHPRAPAVAAFRDAHRERIEFYQYVQWQTEEQLSRVMGATREWGMPVGLYHDFALGSDPNGAEGWLLQDVLALDVDCGCPPDAFALQGQNWGFPPFHPTALREAAYQPWIDMLRQNLRRGGALRLDHVMGLFRLFWIPKGQRPSAGVYVHYPFDELLAILALESHRARTLVIGEDLGTVPDWIRQELGRAQAFSYRVWYFERNGDGSWKAPTQYPAHSLAVATTHDLPTLSGFWMAEDLRVRERLGLFPNDTVQERTWAERRHDQLRMAESLRAHGGWVGPDAAASASEGVPPGLVEAVHRFLARTSSLVVLASLDDWVGERDQANVPGTVDEYPNWLRKTSVPLELLIRDGTCRRLAALMGRERLPEGIPPGPTLEPDWPRP